MSKTRSTHSRSLAGASTAVLTSSNGAGMSHGGRRWSQVVAVAQGVPADVVAIWSQSGGPRAPSDPVTGLLSCGFGGAPRGIRTPNRQIRSLGAAGNLASSWKGSAGQESRPLR